MIALEEVGANDTGDTGFIIIDVDSDVCECDNIIDDGCGREIFNQNTSPLLTCLCDRSHNGVVNDFCVSHSSRGTVLIIIAGTGNMDPGIRKFIDDIVLNREPGGEPNNSCAGIVNCIIGRSGKGTSLVLINISGIDRNGIFCRMADRIGFNDNLSLLFHRIEVTLEPQFRNESVIGIELSFDDGTRIVPVWLNCIITGLTDLQQIRTKGDILRGVGVGIRWCRSEFSQA